MKFEKTVRPSENYTLQDFTRPMLNVSASYAEPSITRVFTKCTRDWDNNSTVYILKWEVLFNELRTYLLGKIIVI